MVGRSRMPRPSGGCGSARCGLLIAAAFVLVGLPVRAAEPSPSASPPAGSLVEAPVESSFPVPFVADLPPVDITPELESGTSVTATLSPDEDVTLSTVDAAGTTYVLLAPAGAVDVRTDVTMTPIAGAAGLPFASGMLFGVDLGPPGLVFDLPLRLEVHLGGGSVPKDLAAWDYIGSGEELALALPEELPDGLAFDIWHFSGVGASVATPAEVATQARSRASSFDRAFQQYLAEVSRSPEAERMAAIDTALEGYWESLRRDLTGATSCDEMADAIRDVVAADRGAERVGSGVRPVARARAAGIWSASVCLEQLWSACAADHDLTAIYGFIRLQRWIDRYGLEDYLGRPQRTRPWIDGCARWEFILDSKAELSGKGPTGGKFIQGNTARGSKSFTAVPEPISSTAAGPWELTTEVSGSTVRLLGIPGCRGKVTKDRVSGVRIDRLNIGFRASTGGPAPASRWLTGWLPQDVRIGFDPGVDESDVTLTCRSVGSFGGMSMKPWNQRWRVHLEKDNEAGRSFGFMRFLFEADSGEVRKAADYARKVYNRTVPVGGFGKLKENTTVELWHRPERPASS